MQPPALHRRPHRSVPPPTHMARPRPLRARSPRPARMPSPAPARSRMRLLNFRRTMRRRFTRRTSLMRRLCLRPHHRRTQRQPSHHPPTEPRTSSQQHTPASTLRPPRDLCIHHAPIPEPPQITAAHLVQNLSPTLSRIGSPASLLAGVKGEGSAFRAFAESTHSRPVN
jgi:hypothetical protein